MKMFKKILINSKIFSILVENVNTMREYRKLEDIDFERYSFDPISGIWSKWYKRWLYGCEKTTQDGQKRRMICLMAKDGEKHEYLYYRVLAYIFVPREGEFFEVPYELLEIDHINGDSTDNRIENLRWTNRKGNMENPITKIRNKAAQPKRPVEQWSKDGKTLIAGYESTQEAARRTGINQGNIYNCCAGRCKTTGGFIWRFRVCS